MWCSSQNSSLFPKEGKQNAGQDANAEDGVNDSSLIKATRAQFVHEGDEQRSHIGQLDDDGQVRGELPAFRESVDDEWKFHPETVHCNPRAEAKGTGKYVHKQSHTASRSVQTCSSTSAVCHTYMNT